MSRRQLLFHELLQLIGPVDGAPWQLQVWDNDAGRYVTLSGSVGGEPLVLDGADPADFLTTDDGDIIIVEDNRG